jgi:hypothetical protein
VTTEELMCDLLDRRYSAVSMGARRYVTARQVRDRPGFARRVCDYMAVDTYQITDGDWSAPRYAVHGHEVKVSRGDWLAELRDPTKADAFRPYVTHWWLVVSDRGIVRDDLPEGWGLMVLQGSRLVRKVAPLVREPEAMPREMIASLLRAAVANVVR